MAEGAGQPVAQLLSPGATVPPEEDSFSDACSSLGGGAAAEAAEEQLEAPAELQGSRWAASEAPADGAQPRGASQPDQQQTGSLAAPSSAGAAGQDLAQHSPAGLPHAEGQSQQQQQAAAGGAPAGVAQAKGAPSDQFVLPPGSVDMVQGTAPAVGPALAAEIQPGELQSAAVALPAPTKQQESPQGMPPAAVGPQPPSSPQRQHELPGQVSAAGLQPGASACQTSAQADAGPSLEHLRTVYDEIASTMLGGQGGRRQPEEGDAEAAGRQQANSRMLSSQGSSSRGQAAASAATEQPQQPVTERVRAASLQPVRSLTAAAAAPQAGGGPQQAVAAQPAEVTEVADKAQLPGPGTPGTGVGQPQAGAEAARVSLLCVQH